MSSVTFHFLMGAALALPAIDNRSLSAVLPRWAIPIGSGFLAAAPDLDVVVRRVFDLPPTSLFSHRALFHSPIFLIGMVGLLAAVLTCTRSYAPFLRLWLVWAACTLSHPLIDALSSGGQGVMLFLPFSTRRIFFCWRPIPDPAGTGERLLSRATLLRGPELYFCLAVLSLGASWVCLSHHRRHRDTFRKLTWGSPSG